MEYSYEYKTKTGVFTLASNGEEITGLWKSGQKYYGATLDKEVMQRTLPVFKDAVRWLDCYFKGKKPDFELPLAPKGSEFRQLIWGILCEIPYGELITYGEIARIAAARSKKERMSAQAVGGAVGHNPISIIIPCHRVVGADNSLTGYAGGLDTKIMLLTLEKADIKNLRRPVKGTAL